MDSPFIYDRFVTGKDFIGRKEDTVILGNLISQGENVAIYEPPKAGKSSVIQQTLFNMKFSGHRYTVGELNLLNIRQLDKFLYRLGATALRTVCSTADEYKSAVNTHLQGTHFVFDPKQFSEKDEIISNNGELDDNDLERMLNFPYQLAREHNIHIILIINEFQNISFQEDEYKVFKKMEQVLKENRPSQNPECSFILCGSQLNAMKYIFEYVKYFYRLVDHYPLSPVDGKTIAEHTIRGFLSGGKVIDRNLLLGVCSLFKNNLWYINHFCAIVNSLTKGYITEANLLQALQMILNIHESRFVALCNDLTNYQVNLLKAILEGQIKLSSSEVIRKYGLNSSANVKRLKEALMKKEIITFDENDVPSIIDPLFEYWLKKYFFEIEA